MNQVDPVYKMNLNGLLPNSYSPQIQFTDSMIQSQKFIVNHSLDFSLFTQNTSKRSIVVYLCVEIHFCILFTAIGNNWLKKKYMFLCVSQKNQSMIVSK